MINIAMSSEISEHVGIISNKRCVNEDATFKVLVVSQPESWYNEELVDGSNEPNQTHVTKKHSTTILENTATV